jgi:hypothetical protein
MDNALNASNYGNAALLTPHGNASAAPRPDVEMPHNRNGIHFVPSEAAVSQGMGSRVCHQSHFCDVE